MNYPETFTAIFGEVGFELARVEQKILKLENYCTLESYALHN
jgi:hypothetical protein